MELEIYVPGHPPVACGGAIAAAALRAAPLGAKCLVRERRPGGVEEQEFTRLGGGWRLTAAWFGDPAGAAA